MTYKELMQIRHPEKVGEGYCGGVEGCPHQYFNVEKNHKCEQTSCSKCWDRKAPTELYVSMNEIRKQAGLKPVVQRNETLVIGVDITNDDVACVTIGKLNGIRTDVVKVIRGDAAKELYEILTNTNIDS